MAAQQEPADVLHMSEASAKYSRWIVRVVEPRMVAYTINARNEQVNASKFMCYLVSKNEAEYAQGTVRFDFNNRSKPQKAFAKFKAGSVWQLLTPAFDSRTKGDWIAAPLKRLILLEAPTKVSPVMDGRGYEVSRV